MSNTQAAEEYIIYLTTNMVNGKIYVGQRKLQYNKEDETYKGSGKLIKAALLKYGEENFKRVILQEAFSPEEADDIETYYIKQLDARNPKVGYNIHIGGNNQCGENNAAYGVGDKKVYCIEKDMTFRNIKTAAKELNLHTSTISNICNGKTISSNSLTFEFIDCPLPKKQRIIQNKEILCITNGIIYSSIGEAARQLKLTKSCVISACKGKLSSVKGLTFKYLNEESTPFIDKIKIPIRCIDDGKEFAYINEASKFYGITAKVIYNILKGKKSITTQLKFEKI